jgi:hypothetical protein
MVALVVKTTEPARLRRENNGRKKTPRNAGSKASARQTWWEIET